MRRNVKLSYSSVIVRDKVPAIVLCSRKVTYNSIESCAFTSISFILDILQLKSYKMLICLRTLLSISHGTRYNEAEQLESVNSFLYM